MNKQSVGLNKVNHLAIIASDIERSIAFYVNDIEACITELQAKGVKTEPVRIDPFTGCKCIFFTDPDGLPIELVE